MIAASIALPAMLPSELDTLSARDLVIVPAFNALFISTKTEFAKKVETIAFVQSRWMESLLNLGLCLKRK